jgi:cephalosporin hydroxylase
MRSLAALTMLLVLAGCATKPAPPGISVLQLRERSFEKRLLTGFYAPEGDWRWTQRNFAASLDAPPVKGDIYLELDFGLPAEAVGEAVKLTASINGVPVGADSYTAPGRYMFSRRVPPVALRQRPLRVEFALAGDGRQQGLQAVSLSLVPYEESRDFVQAQTKLAHDSYRQFAARRSVRLTPQQDSQFMRLYHELGVWQHMYVHNVPIMKNPLDLWIMQQLVYETRPDFIVETGTAFGGSAMFWAQTLEGMGLDQARVVTVDIADSRQAAATDPLWKKHVEFLRGSSTDPAIIAAIRKRIGDGRTMVALDSDHSRAHVLRELRLYSPMVSRGAYLIVEDTHLDGVPTNPDEGPGPMAAVVQFLSQGGSAQFEQDFSRETMAMSFNPGGWLRRK